MYSSVDSSGLKALIDLERKWRKFPKTKEDLSMTPQGWDLPSELIEITDSRNQLGILSKKPIPEEASLKFSVVDHVKEAMITSAIEVGLDKISVFSRVEVKYNHE